MTAPSVLVLGGSVTGGGGVGNDPTRAWHTLLRNVKPTVHYKGAINPSYFLHCTHRFVDHNQYDVALFDLGPNMYGTTSEQHMRSRLYVRSSSHDAPVAHVSLSHCHRQGGMDGRLQGL